MKLLSWVFGIYIVFSRISFLSKKIVFFNDIVCLCNVGCSIVDSKTLLKLTIPRIKLLRNRRDIQIKQMRREIAKLLETGQEATARIRVRNTLLYT